MTSKQRSIIAVAILIAVSGFVFGTYSARQYRTVTGRELHNRLLQQALHAADAMAENSAAVAAYSKLPATSEIQLRILHRQWLICLELLRYMQRARYNKELQNEEDVYSAKLKSLLDDMLERCNSMLAEGDALRTDIMWQIYNVAGSAKLLTAYLMLENEKNTEKVQGVMRDALTDLKAAIEAVDKAHVPPFQRNIPRWNFELLNGEQYIKKFEVAKTDAEKNQALKENLETLIPEMGGYAPGEPIEVKIKK
jgi:hypothetical protein